ncbi:uncharacterized protein LOC125536898 [Triticum urartu]|uniref:uncharacterized protein LOC125536898 n=1 Tax=Triticum urartu TaxID=4572 RepID=UPI002042C0E9|nr:uncharacterized protein LOC125536898 [Triticum urartu]
MAFVKFLVRMHAAFVGDVQVARVYEHGSVAALNPTIRRRNAREASPPAMPRSHCCFAVVDKPETSFYSSRRFCLGQPWSRKNGHCYLSKREDPTRPLCLPCSSASTPTMAPHSQS